MIIQAELKRKQTGCEGDPWPWIRSLSCQASGSGSSAAHCWLTMISSQRTKMPFGTMMTPGTPLILDAEGTDGFLVDPRG